jgi:alkylation response protein AidB-like acyl-CoA dehydrogenase
VDTVSYQEDPYHGQLSQIIRSVVAPSAEHVDRQGSFPRDAVHAFGRTGLLGLTVSADVGGRGKGLREAADVVARVARVCASTASVLGMHYAAVAVLEDHDPCALRAEIATGRHLSTVAFFEPGARGPFSTPTSTAFAHADVVDLHVRKNSVVAAAEADSYLVSTRPVSSAEPMTLWLVPADAPGLHVPADVHAVGLRGNACSSLAADPVRVPRSAMLGPDGAGLDIALHTALPWFLALHAAVCLGLMEGAIDCATSHLRNGHHEPGSPPQGSKSWVRADLARMWLAADTVRVQLADVLDAVCGHRADARMRLFAVKAAADTAAVYVTDLAMKVCGDAAFRTDVGLESRFRDARAAAVLPPTSEAALDVIGGALCGASAPEDVFELLAPSVT